MNAACEAQRCMLGVLVKGERKLKHLLVHSPSPGMALFLEDDR